MGLKRRTRSWARRLFMPLFLAAVLGWSGVVSGMPSVSAPGKAPGGAEGAYPVEEGAALETVEIVLLVVVGLLGGMLGIAARRGVVKTAVDVPVSGNGPGHVLDL